MSQSEPLDGYTDIGAAITNLTLTEKNIRTLHEDSTAPRSILKTSTSKSCNSTNDTCSTTRSREVAFDTISVRKYDMEIGNNPACSIGTPVQLSWDYEEESPIDLDIYEIERRPRRPLRHLILTFYRRRDILLNAGFSTTDIASAERANNKIRRQRRSTSLFLPVSRVEELAQSAGRKVMRVAGRDKKKTDSNTSPSR